MPALLNIDAHDSVGGWFDEMRARGISVPLDACRGLSQAMGHLDLDFPTTFRLLWSHGKILLAERSLVYDLSASSLWQGR